MSKCWLCARSRGGPVHWLLPARMTLDAPQCPVPFCEECYEMSKSRTAPAEVVTVQHPDGMDNELFELHMDHRHGDSLGGLEGCEITSESQGAAWRAFHRRLHAVRVGLDHVHGEY